MSDTPQYVWLVTVLEWDETVNEVICATELRAAQEAARLRVVYAGSDARISVSTERMEVLP